MLRATEKTWRRRNDPDVRLEWGKAGVFAGESLNPGDPLPDVLLEPNMHKKLRSLFFSRRVRIVPIVEGEAEPEAPQSPGEDPVLKTGRAFAALWATGAQAAQQAPPANPNPEGGQGQEGQQAAKSPAEQPNGGQQGQGTGQESEEYGPLPPQVVKVSRQNSLYFIHLASGEIEKRRGKKQLSDFLDTLREQAGNA